MASFRNLSMALVVICTSFPLCSCLSGNLGRTEHYELVPPHSSASWVAGQTTLQDCLSQLGAPIDVWESPTGGSVMAWYGSDISGWSLTMSVPVGQALSASASYSDIQDVDRGVVLFFDPGWVLTTWSEGEIAELVREGRRRPSVVE